MNIKIIIQATLCTAALLLFAALFTFSGSHETHSSSEAEKKPGTNQISILNDSAPARALEMTVFEIKTLNEEELEFVEAELSAPQPDHRKLLKKMRPQMAQAHTAREKQRETLLQEMNEDERLSADSYRRINTLRQKNQLLITGFMEYLRDNHEPELSARAFARLKKDINTQRILQGETKEMLKVNLSMIKKYY